MDLSRILLYVGIKRDTPLLSRIRAVNLRIDSDYQNVPANSSHKPLGCQSCTGVVAGLDES